jgi:spore coat polysaccharide biosynthesis protein SpsF (cytidylyltransferase family)
MEAGIDTEIFKAHSLRGASTTAAANALVPLREILNMADWSNASIFRQFYYKPVFSSSFGETVLS